ncbi:MAG: DUF2079 domain-containing protein, partial [Nitrososphaerales archaeon]
ASQWSSPFVWLESAVYSPPHLILAPLALLGSPPAFLLAQTIGLASGAIAVHEIARRHLGGQVGPLLLSASYLLYPAIAGINWFDFHWEAFFVPLFLFGYLLLEQRRYWFSVGLLLLGGLTTYPYLILPGLFGFVVAIEALWPWLAHHLPVDRSRLSYGTVLLVLAAALLVYQTFYLSSFDVSRVLSGVAFSQTTHTAAATVTSPLMDRLLVLAVFLVPLGLLPLFSPKWLVMLAPFAYLILSANCWCYTFPSILQLQYGALAMPIVFAGSIEVLGRSRNRAQDVRNDLASTPSRALSIVVRLPWRLPQQSERTRRLWVPVAVLCVCGSMALVLQPYGPLNHLGPDPYPVSDVTGVNMTYFDEFSHLVDMVPRSTPSFLIQNDMPYALPRTLAYLQTPLVASEVSWGNLSSWDVAENEFPLILFNGETVQAQVNYLLDNPAGADFGASTSVGVSMYNFVRATYGSGYYGVRGQASGMLLLERDYPGPPLYYLPYAQNFSAAALYTWQTDSPSHQPVISRSNTTGQRIWWGPYATLSP